MAEFLDSFDAERRSLLGALEHFEQVWSRFLQRRGIEVEGDAVSDSLIASELALIRRELETSAFTVGIFGLIKRGKSTLLNAMVGRQVSAMHVTPETAVPVYVTYSDTPGAEVHFADGSVAHVAVEEVEQYTSQKHNPGNRRGVTYVHQRVPVGFLRHGARLIDTPGLDDAHADDIYTARTMQELDVCHAGILVFLSPPTVSATEMRFLEEVTARNLRKTFLVCNMYPQHFFDPQVRREVLDYVGRRIVEAVRRAGGSGEVRIYPVCALAAWEARLEGDIDRWKSSGASRLMRDIETYLTEVAAGELLADAARRIIELTEVAKGEVSVRLRLLEDPDQLAEHRRRLDANIRQLEEEYDRIVAAALSEVAPLKSRVRGLMLQPFAVIRSVLERATTVEELRRAAERFRREVEVAGELASRQFAEGFGHIVDRIRTALEQRFHAVMSDLAPNLPEIRLGRSALLISPEQVADLAASQHRRQRTRLTGTAAGALTGAGVALAAAGGLLGPLGLLGGALVGWKLSDLFGDRSLQATRRLLEERVDEVARTMIADLDRQVEEAVATLRRAAERRRQMFAADLYTQFDLVEGLAEDPALLDSYRRDAQRFEIAFASCADRVRRSVAVPVAV